MRGNVYNSVTPFFSIQSTSSVVIYQYAVMIASSFLTIVGLTPYVARSF